MARSSCGCMAQFIDKLRTFLFFKLMTIYLRYLIGFAFVFASIVKIQGKRFTQIPATEPIGYFFEAMYSTGMYWNFLGWGQFISGALLMTQRFSTVGAMVFLPVILNVFMITHSIDFGSGTPLVTTLMLLGTIYLIAWDYKKWIILFYPDHRIKLDLTTQPRDQFMTHPIWTVTGIIFIVLSVYPWMFQWRHFALWCLLMVVIGVGTFVIMMVMRRRIEATATDLSVVKSV